MEKKASDGKFYKVTPPISTREEMLSFLRERQKLPEIINAIKILPDFVYRRQNLQVVETTKKDALPIVKSSRFSVNPTPFRCPYCGQRGCASDNILTSFPDVIRIPNKDGKEAIAVSYCSKEFKLFLVEGYTLDEPKVHTRILKKGFIFCDGCKSENVELVRVVLTSTDRIRCMDCGALFENKAALGNLSLFNHLVPVGKIAEEKTTCPKCNSGKLLPDMNYYSFFCNNCNLIFIVIFVKSKEPRCVSIRNFKSRDEMIDEIEAFDRLLYSPEALESRIKILMDKYAADPEMSDEEIEAVMRPSRGGKGITKK